MKKTSISDAALPAYRELGHERFMQELDAAAKLSGTPNEAAEQPIGIGSTIWRKDGRTIQGPVYREHWRPLTIDAETSRSWVCGPKWAQYKVPKKGPHPGFAFTQQEVDDDVWVNEHRSRIVREIEWLNDASVLRQIAALIGHQGDSKP